MRRQLLALPGQLTRGGRRCHLYLSVRWPWRSELLIALGRLQLIPMRC